MFLKYPHIERLGSDEVDGILQGEVYVFPKIDGTNGSIWWDDGLHFGSRGREITVDDDNQGFAALVSVDLHIADFMSYFPSWRLYGEFLIPHSLKTYREDAWRKFYVFDVMDDETGEFLRYDDYEPYLSNYDLYTIPVQAIVKNPTEEWLLKQLEANTFLIRDGAGVGEGIVLKNYQFVNRYGRVTWAKIVRNEFKEQNRKAFGAPTVEMYNFEYEVVQEFLTEHVVRKVKAECEPWSSKRIPELLNRVWHEFITEETWAILKKHKYPTINFSALYRYVIQRTKDLLPEVF